MPYYIGKSQKCPASKPYAVIKKTDGKVMGCHASKFDAGKQVKALYANEGSK